MACDKDTNNVVTRLCFPCRTSAWGPAWQHRCPFPKRCPPPQQPVAVGMWGQLATALKKKSSTSALWTVCTLSGVMWSVGSTTGKPVNKATVSTHSLEEEERVEQVQVELRDDFS